ncbi:MULTISPECIES: ThiF family adenylyltransferase [Bacteroides]|uniref:HesA/MoeB/ThiF family protein n=1 Tax=Bacteroides TaxID=816 RepID=UPI002659EC1C|nr:MULTISPECIES: ThiF family adenylyltransferase [Bacteroides]
MITESDFGKRVYYIDGEQLNQFVASSEYVCTGYGYEWEKEGVTHIHFFPLEHSFGKKLNVSFAKENGHHLSDANIKVDIASNGSALVDGTEVTIIPSRENLYKRNKGLIELDILANKRVLIIGLGSGGSPIAVELAKAGVGQFALADFDRIELHNLSRHICSLNDLGRLKTDAVSDAIKGKNPYAVVDKLPIDVSKNLDILEEEIKKADIVMCCTDNNSSRFHTSELLVKHNKVGLFGRAITRAEGGDVFIYRPGQACYFCLLGSDWYDQSNEEITNEASARRAGHIPAYVSAEDAEAFVQVGLGADIEPINNMMVKLALVELSRGTESGISSLEDEFQANYYIWANRRERQYTNWGSFHNTNGMPTIMKWYGINISKDDDCTLCGHKESLATDETFLESLKAMGSGDFSGLNLEDISDTGLQNM